MKWNKKKQDTLESFGLAIVGFLFLLGLPTIFYTMGSQYQTVESLNALLWGILYGAGISCCAAILLEKVKKEAKKK